MFMDTIGMSKEAKVAHRQLADYVWINDGPPVADNEILREITSCAASEWARVKRELIGKGWIETPKFFLHKGIVKTLNLSKEKAVESYNRTCAANGLPRRKLLDPDPETGVTHYVTSDVTPTDRDREGDIPPPTSAREVPDFDSAFAQTAPAAIPKDFCRYVYDDWFSREGKDAGGSIVKWLPYVTKRWAREQNEWKNGTHKGKRNESSQRNTAKGNDRNSGTYNANTSNDALKSKVR